MLPNDTEPQAPTGAGATDDEALLDHLIACAEDGNAPAVRAARGVLIDRRARPAADAGASNNEPGRQP